MPTYPVSVDVSDFTGNSTAPGLAFATISRATVDAATGEIITEAPVSIRLTATPVMVQLEQDVAYRVHLLGVAGIAGTFYVRHNTAASLAELYRAHQVDPTSLQPAPIPPTTQELLEQANEVLTQVQSYGFSAAPDAADVDALQITYPAQMVDPADADAILFTTGA
jgi:hypothetical protein